MNSLHLIAIILFVSTACHGQGKTHRTVSDGVRKYNYSDSEGVTRSYIDYFSDTFHTPVLKMIDGKMLTREDIANKTIVYNFWYVLCRPCVAEIPALNKLADKYQSDSVLFIAITFDNETRTREFLQKHPFHFQIASLPQEEIDKIKKVAFYPFTAIVNKHDRLSFALFARPIGKNPEEEIFRLLDKQVEKVLQE